MTDPAVEADQLGKTYRVYPRPLDRLVEALVRRPRHRAFTALDDVSFRLEAGSSLALVGENGAGKSTLLKILAGITTPTRGRAATRGRVAAILELGSGFHPEFSGRQNILLQAAMLGLSREEAQAKLPAIIAFSELGDFIDQPVKTYSTGMSMRLGFAIATQVEPEVLIIDEALSVGDGYFQKKCMDRLVHFLDRGGTLLLCSHAMYYVSSFCERALWLRGGRMEGFGPALEVVHEYENYLLARRAEAGEAEAEPPQAGPARFRRIEQVPAKPPGERVRPGERWALECEWETDDPELGFHVVVGVDRRDGVQVFAAGTHTEGLAPIAGGRRHRLRLVVPELPLLKGEFHLTVFLMDERGLHIYDRRRLHAALEVESPEFKAGIFEVDHRWEVDRFPRAADGEAEVVTVAAGSPALAAGAPGPGARPDE